MQEKRPAMTFAPHGHRRAFSRRSWLAGMGVAALGLTVRPARPRAQEPPKLNFYNFDTYIGKNTLSNFRASTGIRVRMDLFSDMGEMFAKLRTGNPGYDVVVITDKTVERMRKADLLAALDHDRLHNLGNLDPSFLEASFDPGRRFSLPYTWGSLGIGYRRSVAGEVSSWRAAYDSAQFRGQLSLLSEPEDVLSVGLKYLGYPLAARSQVALDRVTEMLIAQKPNIRVFAPDNGQDLLLASEVAVAQEWNGDIAQVMQEDSDLTYVIPQEGTLLWQDTLCIPRDAPHPDNALRFIDFLMEPEVAADLAETIQYATPNQAARAYLSPEYLNNPAIFPPPAALEKSEYLSYTGEEALARIERSWARIMAA